MASPITTSQKMGGTRTFGVLKSNRLNDDSIGRPTYSKCWYTRTQGSPWCNFLLVEGDSMALPYQLQWRLCSHVSLREEKCKSKLLFIGLRRIWECHQIPAHCSVSDSVTADDVWNNYYYYYYEITKTEMRIRLWIAYTSYSYRMTPPLPGCLSEALEMTAVL